MANSPEENNYFMACFVSILSIENCSLEFHKDPNTVNLIHHVNMCSDPLTYSANIDLIIQSYPFQVKF